jgi:hypothetical protein
MRSTRPLMSMSSTIAPLPCRKTMGAPLPRSTWCSLTPFAVTNVPLAGLSRSAFAARRLASSAAPARAGPQPLRCRSHVWRGLTSAQMNSMRYYAPRDTSFWE